MTGMYDLKESLGTLLADEPPFELTGNQLIATRRGRRRMWIGASFLVAATVVAAVGVGFGVAGSRAPAQQAAGPGGSTTGARDALAVRTEIFDGMKSRLGGISQAYATTYGLTVNSVEGSCCGDPSSPRGQYRFSVSLQHGPVKSVLNVTADYVPGEPLVTGCPATAPIACTKMSEGMDPVAYIFTGPGPSSDTGRVLRLVRYDGSVVTMTVDDPGGQTPGELDLFLYSVATDQNFDLGAARGFLTP